MSTNTKSGKRDQTVTREASEEIVEEVEQPRIPVRQPNRNRDQARGDWDRTGERNDEGRSRT